MTWTDIPNASLEPGAPARSVDAIALRDNIAHVRDGNNLTQVFTASGTYTKPAGLKRLKVTVIGGGGGGAGCDSGSGYVVSYGGGGGGVAIKVIEASALLSSETVTVGTGGTASTGNNVAGTGGTTSFGAHVSATGGAGGLVSNGTIMPNAPTPSSRPAGGVGVGGDINLYGEQPPEPLWGSGDISGTTNFYPIYGGRGGVPAIPVGKGASGLSTAGNAIADAAGYGAGGGGAYSTSLSQTGSAGTGGLVIIEEFY